MFRDGPLRRRPPEEIRYGTGRSAVGPVLVALSGKGVVTIMVRRRSGELARDLRERFPKAVLVRDDPGCTQAMKKVLLHIAAPVRRFPLPLDIRGTELQKRVWEEVRRIPFGETSTYAKIAAAIGAPKAIRAVASSCYRSWFAFAIPCHRVLHSGSAQAGRRANREGVQYRWADYEARLRAKMQTS